MKEVKAGLKPNVVLWAIVANAGIAMQGPLEWTSMKDIQHIFNINTLGVVRTVKAFLPLVRHAKGRVVVTASMLASVSNTNTIPYSMSKAAVKNMVEGLQREVGRMFGVYFSSIEPNYFATNMMQTRSFDDYLEKYNALDTEMKVDYDRVSFMQFSKNLLASVKNVLTSSKIDLPVAAYEHAVTSMRPMPYYFVDREWMKFLRELARHSNLEIVDYIIHYFQYANDVAKWFKS